VPGITIPPRRPRTRPVFHNYVIMARDRDRLVRFLHVRGVEAKIHYPVPVHLQPAARFLKHGEGDFPRTERQSKTILTLPAHQHLSTEEVDWMIRQMESFGREGP